MPAEWNLPRTVHMWTPEDVEKFTRLPVWMAEQQTVRIGYWSRWQKKYGTIDWERNMGDILQGVMAEPSAITSQKHVPRNITQTPLKTIVRHFERTNSARVKRHLWESPLFHFLPSFRDFRKKQLKFASDDVNKQIAVGADNFVRWQVLQQSPYVWVVGAANPLTAAVHGEATDTTEPKDAGWFGAFAGMIGAGDTGYLNFRQICAVRQGARHTLQIPPWEGMSSLPPKENETVKGKFVLTGDPEIYENLSFDRFILDRKDDKMNLINSEFTGVISENIAFLAERYPLRFDQDGNFPDPEIEQAVTDPTGYGSSSQYETVPNPDYVNAPFAVAFFEGHQGYESIKVGPPPEEFKGGSVSMKKFRNMNWNAEVRITDDVLVDYGSGVYDTNKHGEWLQLIADTVMGIITNTPRYVIPIIYRRVKYPSLLAS